jgi:heme exporter protein C
MWHVDDAAPLQDAVQAQRARQAAAYRRASRCLPWCAGAAAMLGMGGLTVALGVAPVQEEFGEVHRIVFLHVPAAWLSLAGYAFMAATAGWGAWNDRQGTARWPGAALAGLAADAVAPTVAMLALLALWTGAMWGKPGWGAWWVWDARLTAQACLLLLTLAYIVLPAVSEDTARARRLGALLAVAGLAQVPAVYLGAQSAAGAPVQTAELLPWPELSGSPLLAMALMLAATAAWLAAASLQRLRSLLLEADPQAPWVQALPELRS